MVEAMLMGQVQHQLDEKGRIRIPAKFKDELGNKPLITFGSNNCLFVFPEKDAAEILAGKFRGDGMSDTAGTQSQRFLFASAVYAEEDKQGRVLLEQHLIAHAKIKKNIVTIGVQNRVEIWAEEVWREYISGINFDESLKQLEAVMSAKES